MMTAAKGAGVADTYRILVTGSRDWDDDPLLYTTLGMAAQEHGSPDRITVIVHGACPRGADRTADVWARNHQIAVERHPAEWDKYGKAAGFRRNAEMVALGADLCLAFIKYNSRGATHCADLAEKAGIPVRRYDYWAHSEEPVWLPGMGSV